MFLRSKIQDVKLGKRSRAISSRPGSTMSETHSLFASPKGVAAFAEAAASPTSILETKPFSAVRNPFFSSTFIQSKHLSKSPESETPRAIGLGLLDALPADDDGSSGKCSSRSRQRLVLFGSQLKIQIPPHSPPPIEFGIKNRSSQSAVAPSDTPAAGSSPRVFAGCALPQPEIELSEEYTCVILHGPNPKTTHIFDDCIIQSGADYGFVAPKTTSHDLLGDAEDEDDFLSFCYGCKKKLGPGEDVYIYRGEKAFCSHECRYQEMLFDEGDDKF